MKKILMACGVAAALIGAATSCSNSSSTGADGFSDSLSLTFGEVNGLRLASDYNQLPASEKTNLKRDDILRGIKQVVMTDTTQQGYLSGLNIGLQLAGQLMRYEEAGIKIDRAKLYEAYAKAFSADSVSAEQLREAQMTMQTLSQQAQERMMKFYEEQQKAEEEAAMNGEDAKANGEAGEAYIKAQMEKDPSIKKSESGVAYKVVAEGTGEPVGKNGAAVVNYKGSLIDGTVFDQNDGIQFSPGNVVPGFGEMLAQMKKGSHYIILIPGSLAYGGKGVPQAGIGPNATLIFDLEVTEVK